MKSTSGIDPQKFIGRTMGSVTLVSVLGEGGAAMVFSGFQRTLRRTVAVKIILKTNTSIIASSDRFRHEAELIASLNHPNIIPIHEMGEADDCFYQVIQAIQGEDLDSLVKRRQKNPLPSRQILPLSQTIDFMAQILDGLAYAHEEGVVHRDIKPANILIEARRGRPLIADFGIAQANWTDSAASDRIEGTPLYMAPEYLKGEEPDARVDLFAAGIMLYLLAAGSLPLAVRDPVELLKMKMNDPHSIFTERPSKASPMINASLERVILLAIEPDPRLRYQNGMDFKKDLLAVAQTP